MSNIKSAKKRILVINKKTLRNKMVASATKTAVKKVIVAVNAGDKAVATDALKAATKAIDMACTKGILHKNNASRKKSRLAKLVNKMA